MMYIILLFWLASNVFTAMFAMGTTSEFPFHAVVRRVAEKGLDVELAKKIIEHLREQGEDPNVLCNGKTAARLCAESCVEKSNFFENKCAILKFLLPFGEEAILKLLLPFGEEAILKLLLSFGEEASNFNTKDIRQYLDKESHELNTCLEGLSKRPFSATSIYGEGSFITDDEDDEDETRMTRQLERISRVKELVKKSEN